METLTQERPKELLTTIPQQGYLYGIKQKGKRGKIGQRAGSFSRGSSRRAGKVRPDATRPWRRPARS
jgi:hypothetical protein